MKKLRAWIHQTVGFMFHHAMLLLTAAIAFTLSGLLLVFIPYSSRIVRPELAAIDNIYLALIRFAIGGTVGLSIILYFLFWRKIR